MIERFDFAAVLHLDHSQQEHQRNEPDQDRKQTEVPAAATLVKFMVGTEIAHTQPPRPMPMRTSTASARIAVNSRNRYSSESLKKLRSAA